MSTPSTNSIEANKARTRQLVDEVWNRGNYDMLDELVAPDFVNHTPLSAHETREEMKARIRMMREAFPDLVMTIDDLIGEGDRVVTRWTARGTHLGDFRGIGATGRAVEIRGVAIDRLIDGRRVEGWAIIDLAGLMQQIRERASTVAPP